jgi:uncharacterized protein (DUF1778 family)
MPSIANRKNPDRGAPKSERLEARVPVELKTMFQRAADLEGVTLSDFVIRSLVEKSRSTIREHEVITLSGRNRDVFLEALRNPPAVSPRLAAALNQLRGRAEDDAAKKPVRRAGAIERPAQSGTLQQRKRTAR